MYFPMFCSKFLQYSHNICTRIHTGTYRTSLESQDSHRNSSIHTQILESTSKFVEPHWNPKIHNTRISRSQLESRESILKSQNPYYNGTVYVNPRIHTETSGSTLESHDPNCKPKILTGISGSTLKAQDPHWNTMNHTVFSGFKMESQYEISRSQDSHWNPNTNPGILGFIQQSQDPH